MHNWEVAICALAPLLSARFSNRFFGGVQKKGVSKGQGPQEEIGVLKKSEHKKSP